MTTATVAQQRHDGFLPKVDPLGDTVGDISQGWGVTVVVEALDGSIVTHAATDEAPLAARSAILTRSARPLSDSFTKGTTAGLLMAGTARSGVIQKQPTLVLPVSTGTVVLARLWLIGPHPDCYDRVLTRQVAELGDLLGALGDLRPQSQLANVLVETDCLPTSYTGMHVYVMAATSTRLTPVALAHALRPGPRSWLLQSGVLDIHTVGIIGLIERTTAEQVAHNLERWCDAHGIAQGLHLGVSCAGKRPPREALAEAITTLGAGLFGCHTLTSARPHLVRRRVGQLLQAAGDLGPDPAAALLEHRELARSLMAWLDHQGQSAKAAEALDCHPNTLRYRVRRALGMLPGELRDPDLRLEVHLRLKHFFDAAQDQAHISVSASRSATEVERRARPSACSAEHCGCRAVHAPNPGAI